MKTSALMLPLLLLAGCSSMNHPALEAHKPQESLTTTPYVEFMGDDQIMGVVSYVGNPLWRCSTCAQGLISSQVLAKVPAVIALKPSLVVVQTGAYDLYEDIPGDAPGRDVELFNNVTAIMDALTAANIPVEICGIPDSTAYDDYYFDEGLEIENEAGLLPNLFTFNFTSGADLTAGIDYSQAGLMAVYPAFYLDVEGFQLGGQK